MKLLLRRVIKTEGQSVTKEIYEQIVQDSLGHPRNALQILAQVLSASPEQRLAVAKRTAEVQSQTIELCRALISNSGWKKVASILNGLKDKDPEQIRRAILGYCQAILLKGKSDAHTATIMQEFLEPFYNTGFPGLTYACFSALFGEDDD